MLYISHMGGCNIRQGGVNFVKHHLGLTTPKANQHQSLRNLSFQLYSNDIGVSNVFILAK